MVLIQIKKVAGSKTAVEQGIELLRRGGKMFLVGINGNTTPLKFTSDFYCLNDLHIEGVYDKRRKPISY